MFLSSQLFGQTVPKNDIVEKNLTKTTNKIILNDLSTFKSQFKEWNVGNLHVFSRTQKTKDADYYYTGQKISPMFQPYLPKGLRQKVVIQGSEPYLVASIKGRKLKDYYILRINDGLSKNTIVLYELKKDRLKPKKTLAYFYQKDGQTFQRDSWITDINGDTRLDIIQKTQITDKNGSTVKQKTKVFLKKKNGKYNRNRKIKFEESDYKMKKIK